jgi:hypothetical protein
MGGRASARLVCLIVGVLLAFGPGACGGGDAEPRGSGSDVPTGDSRAVARTGGDPLPADGESGGSAAGREGTEARHARTRDLTEPARNEQGDRGAGVGRPQDDDDEPGGSGTEVRIGGDPLPADGGSRGSIADRESGGGGRPPGDEVPAGTGTEASTGEDSQVADDEVGLPEPIPSRRIPPDFRPKLPPDVGPRLAPNFETERPQPPPSIEVKPKPQPSFSTKPPSNLNHPDLEAPPPKKDHESPATQ